MDKQGSLAERFEENRPRLRGVAYRLLGSLAEAEDAVQEAWLRLNRTDSATLENLDGWLTTVVSRVCLDMLRSRRSRREQPMTVHGSEPAARQGEGFDPEAEALLADSVGVALLVVLETLSPAERLAFVLHDLFGMRFDEVGAIMRRTPAAAKQLASRARRRVSGAGAASDAGRARQRKLVDAFLHALRAGDLDALLSVLDPDAVVRIDAAARFDGVVRIDAPAAEAGRARELKGASTWAAQLLSLARGLRSVEPALIDGSVGLVLAPRGRLLRAVTFTFAPSTLTHVDVIGDPARLRELDIAVL